MSAILKLVAAWWCFTTAGNFPMFMFNEAVALALCGVGLAASGCRNIFNTDNRPFTHTQKDSEND